VKHNFFPLEIFIGVRELFSLFSLLSSLFSLLSSLFSLLSRSSLSLFLTEELKREREK